MSNIERPGINNKWSKRMKTWHRGNMAGWRDGFDSHISEALENYVEQGRIPGCKYRDGDPNGTYMKWTTDLREHLGMYTLLREFEFERLGTSGGGVDISLASRAFGSFYLKEMIGCHSAGFRFEDTPFVALGIVLGCKEQGFRLARLRIGAFRRAFAMGADPLKGFPDHDRLSDNYPVLHFMLRLLADYLGELPHLVSGKAVEEPVFQALLEHWREPDPAALVPLCLAACDIHTHRCWEEEDDFAMSHFMYIPIEILLLYKLRQFLGLQNPQLDHPLMNGPLGALPPETACEPDDLIRRVRERMEKEGFDEAKILARYYPDGNIPKP